MVKDMVFMSFFYHLTPTLSISWRGSRELTPTLSINMERE
jgi:hypothetical protein